MTKNTKTEFIQGTRNVFADTDLPDAEAHLLKANLVSRIMDIKAERGLTQTALGKAIGIAQPDVSKMLKGHFEKYSVERLLRFLRHLDYDVSIVVTPQILGESVTIRVP